MRCNISHTDMCNIAQEGWGIKHSLYMLTWCWEDVELAKLSQIICVCVYTLLQDLTWHHNWNVTKDPVQRNALCYFAWLKKLNISVQIKEGYTWADGNKQCHQLIRRLRHWATGLINSGITKATLWDVIKSRLRNNVFHHSLLHLYDSSSPSSIFYTQKYNKNTWEYKLQWS